MKIVSCSTINLSSKILMIKSKRFFAFLALFLGFFYTAISFNLNLTKQAPLNDNFHAHAVKAAKNPNEKLPLQFFEPVDEREIDEDNELKFNGLHFMNTLCFNYFGLLLYSPIKTFLSCTLQQDFSISAPRIILFHSRKDFI